MALAALDIVLAACVFAFSYLLRFQSSVGGFRPVEHAPPVEYLKMFVVIGVAFAVLARLHQLYRTDFLHTTLEETYAIAKVVTLATAVGLVGAFFYRPLEFSRFTLPLFWLLSVVMISVAHATYRRWLVGRYARGLDRHETVVVGMPTSHLLERLRSVAAFGVDVVGWIGERRQQIRTAECSAGWERTAQPFGPGELVRSARGSAGVGLDVLARLGSVEDIAEVLTTHNIRQVIILDSALTHDQLLTVIEACEQHGIEIRMIPPIYDLLVEPSDLSFIDCVPLMRVDEARHRRTGEGIKRAFDVVGATVLLILFAPVFAVVAAAIRWTTPGPILFRQTRAGRNGLPFAMLKFRTMVPDAEQRLRDLVDVDRLAEPVFKLVRDPRVTPVGRWLRRLSLDELPQLLNVLKGDMSLVGPRPEELKIVNRYDLWQRRRLKVKPGITGLQQVEARGTPNLCHRVRLDIYYTRKQSLLLDMVILARTVEAVISGRGAT